MRLQNGFTLIELMITIAIMGVLMSIAAPSFQSIILGARLTSASNAMVSALQLARSEAIKQNKTVIVEPLSSNNWQSGWQVFVDTAGNGIYDPATDTLLTMFDAVNSSVTVNSSSNSIFYEATGRLPSGVSSSVIFCTNADNQDFRAVVISLTGRVHVETSSNSSRTYASSC